MCGCFWKHFIFFNEHYAASERYQCATASERKCAADIFYVEANVWLFLKTFHVFNECVAASEKILTTASESYEKNNVQLLLRIMST